MVSSNTALCQTRSVRDEVGLRPVADSVVVVLKSVTSPEVAEIPFTTVVVERYWVPFNS